KFTVAAGVKPISVSARFFRGWNQEHTYAVVQWYAWSNGGSPAPMDWFWVDQQSQWRDHQHTPWVAVSLLLPLPPLGDLETVQAQAISLGQVVQTTLMQTALHSPA
ncbi:MAG TPA: cyanoexosortase B system-associated protein, partial [Allocoleopsis sp.]